jgi:hypothetical protein
LKKGIYIGFLLALMFLNTKAQEVILKMDSTRFLIGDWITTHLKIQIPVGQQIVLPDIYNTWSDFEILDISEIDTIVENEQVNFSYSITFSKYDTGFFPLPPLVFNTIIDNNIIDSFLTAPMLIEILGVAIDTANVEPKPIKEIIPEKITLKEIISRFFWIPLLVLLIILLIWLYKKWNSKELKVVEEKKEKIPPHIIALEHLADLHSKKLWQKGEIKPYYIDLSDIVRTYIENRFNSPALESTSDEIISNLQRKTIPKKLIDDLSFMLKTADLAKFAKFNPLSDENEKCYEIAKEFIIQTKEQEEIKTTEDA